jgi:hypothetical protein
MATPGYLVRRKACTHDDDSGVIAAVRERFPADIKTSPIVVRLRRTLRGRGLAVNAEGLAELRVNKGYSQVAATLLVSLAEIESR